MLSEQIQSPVLTARGFELIQFRDGNGEACSLQQSSAAREDGIRPGDSMLWLGTDDPWPKRLVPNEGWQPIPPPRGMKREDLLCCGRMHLTREQAAALARRMLAWVESGSLCLEGESPNADSC